jgi:serine/threonine protein kinase/Tol biopolymer transport system component
MSMIGKSLVHYQIAGLIGKGGMGEVYQAKDQKLGRDVAIKVLPVEFARDTDRVTRFRREAKLLASLNHPNIASIYGLEETGGTHFLVMELIEGNTLADMIKAGPIPVEDALKLALQITEALEAAHDKGVIHRDLKPANIKVTPEGKVKVLDFGLAKAFAGDPADMNMSNSPTLSDAATMQGVILGTAAYMPPEQAKGKTVDKRADIWAFGVVLFEMLTGRQSFTGESVSETLASVIKSEPEWQSLPPNLHPRIRFLLERCLEKDPRNRYGAINDARVDIQKVLADPGGVFVRPAGAAELCSKQRSTLSLVAAAVILTAIIVSAVIWYLKPAPPPEPRRVVRLSYALPDDQQFNIRLPVTGHTLAVSPDGGQCAYSTKGGLYLRSEDDLEARLISGTDKENPQSPFFSPDGKWVGYWSQQNRQLRKISVSGGSPVTLCTVAWTWGAEWRPDNTIVFSDIPRGIFRVSADGGTPELLVEGLAIAPQLLPDGKSILFTSVAKDPYTIVIQSLESGKRKELFAGVAARYLPTGHIVYGTLDGDTLFSVPFDPVKLDVTGGSAPRIAGMLNPFFAVSDSGTLAYIPGVANDAPASGRTLVWVDRMGKETPINAPPNFYTVPDISPDGTKVALAANIDENMDIYIWDIARENLTRLTFDKKTDIQPIWTPDGKRIVYMSNRDGMFGIYSQAANGTGEVVKHCSVPDLHLLPWSWSHDGKTLVIAEMSADYQKVDIGTLSMEANGARKLLLKEDYMENHPQISPDGRWMAYFSDESGEWGIYVRPFPDVDQGKWQVGGGESPRWSPDGRELYYITQKGDAVMAVPVETAPTFSAGKPRELFRGTFIAGYRESPPYDIDRDGKRFLMIKPPRVTGGESAEALPRNINIVLNWFEELKQPAPAK